MLLDTHAWIELLRGSALGNEVATLLSEQPCFTAMPTLTELGSWTLRRRFDHAFILKKVRSLSTLLPLSEDGAILAGKLHFEFRKSISDWGMLDSLIYATALLHGQELVTGDPHFKGKPHVIFLGES
ncbi:PIN domain-containing protein [Candidatus Micrarchaeota archaeon]|nr:PIN domain-containing protein [Candidatus Micrarchaeota archaeon]